MHVCVCQREVQQNTRFFLFQNFEYLPKKFVTADNGANGKDVGEMQQVS